MPPVDSEMVMEYVRRLDDALDEIHAGIGGYQARENALRERNEACERSLRGVDEEYEGVFRGVNEECERRLQGMDEEYERRLQGMDEEYEMKLQRVDEAHAGILQGMDDAQHGLERDMDELRRELGECSATITKQNAALLAEREQSGRCAARVGELESALDQATQRPLTGDDAYNTLQQNYDFLKGRYNSIAVENTGLEKTIAVNAGIRQQLDEANADNAGIRRELDEAIAENQRIADQDYTTFAENKKLVLKITSMQNIITALDNEIAVLRDQSKEHQRQRGVTEALHRERATNTESLRQQLLQCTKDNESLQGELQHVRQELAVLNMEPRPGDQTLNVTDDGGRNAEEMDRLETEVQRLRQEQEENTRVQASLEDRNRAVAEENQHLRTERTRLDDQLRLCEEAFRATEELRANCVRSLGASEQERETVSLELQAVRADYATLMEQKDALAAAVVEHENAALRLQDRAVASGEATRNQKNQITALNTALEEERALYTELETAYTTALVDLEGCRKEQQRRSVP